MNRKTNSKSMKLSPLAGKLTSVPEKADKIATSRGLDGTSF